MILLHTGVPGSGKTLTMIDELMHNKVYQDRTVYVHAVEGLSRGIKIRCGHQGCRACRHLTDEEKSKMKMVEDWQSWADVGSLLLIDEAHYPFPQRRKEDAPLYIQRLTEHRHDGIDFWLCTPNANLLDINVRRLVERHIHHLNGIISRFRISHSECMESEERLRFGVKERFTLPKRSFSLYKSADAHVKIKTKIPKFVYWLAFLILLIPVLGYFTYNQLFVLRREAVDQGQASRPQQEAIAQPGFESLRISRNQSLKSRSEYYENLANVSYIPRLENLPESSPEYDLASAPPVNPPQLSGCMLRRATMECTCYTQQATPYQTTAYYCRAVLAGKIYRPDLDSIWPDSRGIRPTSSQPITSIE